VNSNFNDKFYGRFRKRGERIDETVRRVDDEIINNNFEWMCERDTLRSDVIINTELCESLQKSPISL
jgi:hypothetical protein